MYIKKSTGPKTEPCGTPLSTSAQVDALPFMQLSVFYFLFSVSGPPVGGVK